MIKLLTFQKSQQGFFWRKSSVQCGKFNGILYPEPEILIIEQYNEWDLDPHFALIHCLADF